MQGFKNNAERIRFSNECSRNARDMKAEAPLYIQLMVLAGVALMIYGAFMFVGGAR